MSQNMTVRRSVENLVTLVSANGTIFLYYL